MPPPLHETIRELIARTGPLRFDRFMELALYSDPHGYYRRHVPQAGADYRTSPTLTPLFGKLVARRLDQIHLELGSLADFTVVEVGGGNGDLAASVLSAFPGRLRWCFVEPFPQVAAVQREAVGDRAEWVTDLSEVRPVTGVVLANEVLDNFPVRLFEVGEEGLLEVHAGIEDYQLVEVLEPSPLSMAAQGHLEPGDRFEVIQGLDEWCAAAAGALEKGYLLAIDYGDLEPDLWVKRQAGSLVTYHEEQLGVDPFESPGDLDITAHVNFSELARAAERSGFSPCPTVSQRAWLKSLGLDKEVEELRQAEAIPHFEGRHGDWMGLIAERSRVEALAARGGLGDYLVFTAKR